MMARELARAGWRVDIVSEGDLQDAPWEGGHIRHIHQGSGRLSQLWQYFAAFNKNKATGVLALGATPFIMVYYLLSALKGKKFMLGIQHDLDVSPDMRIQGWRRWLYVWTLRRASLLLVQHEVQKQHAASLTSCPIAVIPNYILVPVSEKQPPLGVSYLWLGTYRNYKRPEIVLDLAQELPDLSFILVCHPTHQEGTERMKGSRVL